MVNQIGNFAVKEVIRLCATDFNDDLLYTMDQLSGATIEITAETQDINDKNGALIRRIVTSRAATISANLALLSPAAIAAMSNEALEEASATNTIPMPLMRQIPAGSTIDVSDATTGSIRCIEIYSNGAQGSKFTQGTTADVDAKTYSLVTNEGVTLLGVPAKKQTGEGADSYLIVYERNAESGLKISVRADTPQTAVKLIAALAVIDPCSSNLRAAYLLAPNAQPDPSMTLNLSSENTATDINYTLNVDYCGCSKDLFTLYFPDEDAVVSVGCDAVDETPEP